MGDVFVVPYADPLLLNAGAIVIETGEHLSHSPMVSGNDGIPAIVNVCGLFYLLKEGNHLQFNKNIRRIKIKFRFSYSS